MGVIARPLIASLVVAAIAFGLPWITHFADHGLSAVMLLGWIGLLIGALIKYRARGLWLLLGAPLALYWPAVLMLWLTSDTTMGF